MAVEASLTILLVEPDPLARDLARLALRTLQPEPVVVAVADGVDALTQAAEAPPQLILLSLLLPRLGGLATIRQLRQRLGPACPIIAVSALGLREVVEQAITAGASDFLVKPYAPEQLLERIRAAHSRLAVPRPKAA